MDVETMSSLTGFFGGLAIGGGAFAVMCAKYDAQMKQVMQDAQAAVKHLESVGYSYAKAGRKVPDKVLGIANALAKKNAHWRTKEENDVLQHIIHQTMGTDQKITTIESESA